MPDLTDSPRVQAYDSSLAGIDATALSEKISGVSDRMASYMGTPIIDHTVSDETIRVGGAQTFLVPSQHPIQSITTIDENAAALTPGDIEIVNGIMLAKTAWPYVLWDPGVVRLTYVAGYGADLDNIPGDIVDACTMQVCAELRNTIDHSYGFEQVDAAADETKQYVAKSWLPVVRSVMRQYQRFA